jgi:RNA polymerase sigma-70 factor (ECF subfamily)
MIGIGTMSLPSRGLGAALPRGAQEADPSPATPATRADGAERVLLARVRAGDTAAFGEIFDQYQTPLVNYLYRVVGDWELAADLTQDTFLKAYQALPRTEEGLQLAPWLYRIATNTALDTLRRRKRIAWVPFLEDYEPPAPGSDPSTTVPDDDILHQALQALPPEGRIPLILHLHQGLSYKEIAELLGIAPNLVAVRVFRARERFMKAYKALTGDTDE